MEMLACLGLAIVSATGAARMQLDAVAAYVNDDIVTVSDVVGSSPELQRVLAGSERATGDLNDAFAEALDRLIGEHLVLDAYTDQKDVQVPEAMIRERIDAVVERVFDGDRMALLEALARDGVALDDWEAQMRDNVVIQAMRSVKVGRQVRISPVAVRERYEERLEAYARPARARLWMLVLPAEREDLASNLAAKLADGADFATLARAHSIGLRAEDGGDRGWIELNMLRQELADAVRALHGGGTSDVIRAGARLYLLAVEDYAPATAVPFGEVQPEIEAELRAEEEARLYHAWIAELRRDAYVRLLETTPF